MKMKNILSASLLVTSLYWSEQIQDTIDYNSQELLKALAINEENILWYKLYNVEGRINIDIKKTIVKVWKEIEYFLPKWLKMKVKEDSVRVFYQVKF